MFGAGSAGDLDAPRPVEQVVNVLFIRAIDRGFGFRLEPVTGHIVFFAQGRALGREQLASPRVASMMRRLREMAGMPSSDTVANGRVFLRLGPDQHHAFAVQSRQAAKHRRMVVSEVPEVSGRIGLDDAKIGATQTTYERAVKRGEAALAGGGIDGALRHFEDARAAAVEVDSWNTAAALERWCAAQARGAEDPGAAFARLFDYLDQTFGALDPTTLGWKAEIAVRAPEVGARVWKQLRVPFGVVFGEDDDYARALEALEP